MEWIRVAGFAGTCTGEAECWNTPRENESEYRININ